MVEKLFCILGGFLSIFGAFVSTYREDLFTSVSTVTQQEELVFTNVSTRNGTRASFTTHSIVLDSINLKKASSSEVITYEMKNPTSKDLRIKILINGKEVLDDEYFDITCSPISTVKAREKVSGTITITLKKSVVEDYSLPFKITYQIVK